MMKPGYLTSEFLVTLVSQILNALVQSGLIGDGTTLVRGISFAAASLTAIVYTIQRTQLKANHADNDAAAVGPDPDQTALTPRLSQAGFMRLDTAVMVLLFGVGIALIASACGALKSDAKHASTTFVDCMKPELRSASAELESVVLKSLPSLLSDTGQVDKAGFKALTSDLKSDAAGCAIATAVDELSKPRSQAAPLAAPLAVDAPGLRAAWADVRREQFGGRMFAVQDE